MKHIFILLDNLISGLSNVPHSLKSDDEKLKAKKTCESIRDYIASLRDLIEHHGAEESLERLEHEHVQVIEEWAGSVEDLFKQMDELIRHLEEYSFRLDEARKTESEKWWEMVGDILHGIYLTGLLGESREIHKLYNLAILERADLKRILKNQQHILELIK